MKLLVALTALVFGVSGLGSRISTQVEPNPTDLAETHKSHARAAGGYGVAPSTVEDSFHVVSCRLVFPDGHWIEQREPFAVVSACPVPTAVRN